MLGSRAFSSTAFHPSSGLQRPQQVATDISLPHAPFYFFNPHPPPPSPPSFFLLFSFRYLFYFFFILTLAIRNFPPRQVFTRVKTNRRVLAHSSSIFIPSSSADRATRSLQPRELSPPRLHFIHFPYAAISLNYVLTFFWVFVIRLSFWRPSLNLHFFSSSYLLAHVEQISIQTFLQWTRISS